MSLLLSDWAVIAAYFTQTVVHTVAPVNRVSAQCTGYHSRYERPPPALLVDRDGEFTCKHMQGTQKERQHVLAAGF